MVVRSLEGTKDPFWPKEENEELLGPKVPYLSAIGALMYLANYTRSDIAFLVNLLARYSSAPTKRHSNRIKHVLRHLCGTCDMRLFYSKTLEPFSVMQMSAIFRTLTKLDHIQDIILKEILLYPRGQ